MFVGLCCQITMAPLHLKLQSRYVEQPSRTITSRVVNGNGGGSLKCILNEAMSLANENCVAPQVCEYQMIRSLGRE